MSGTDVFYNHSGRFNPLGLGAMFAAALISGPIIGVAYGVIVAFNPFIYVNFLATLFAAAWAGILVGKVSRPGRVRSLGVCAAAGLVAGLAFEYVQWFATLSYYGAELTLYEPRAMWSMIGELAEMEPWTLMGGISIGAVGFKIIWAIEGVMVVGTPILLAMGEGSTPYCERCNEWVSDAEPIGPFDYVSDVDTLKARVERRDLSGLEAFERLEVTQDRYSTITLSTCDGCRGLQLASIQNVEVETDKNGERKQDETDVLTHVVLDAASYDAISKL